MTGQKIIPPGSTIAVLGDGQLGKMLVHAGQRLGFEMLVIGTSVAAPAMQCTSRSVVVSEYTLEEVLPAVRGAHVVTTEWENISEMLMTGLAAAGLLVRPSGKVMGMAQSRNDEKSFAKSIGAMPVPWSFLPSKETYESRSIVGLFPGVLKTDRNGYDGRGQYVVADQTELNEKLKLLSVPCVLERRLPVDYECSILVARTAGGAGSLSDVVRNEHRDGILVRTEWSRRLVPKSIVSRAEEVARNVAMHLDLAGIVVIEFIVSGGNLYFNEMAPRPHNSFHGSIEAAHCSQFEQHVRAICNLPLGEVRFHTPFIMENLLRGEGDEWLRHLDDPSTRVHNYGKQPVVGKVRKMGHVTRLSFR